MNKKLTIQFNIVFITLLLTITACIHPMNNVVEKPNKEAINKAKVVFIIVDGIPADVIEKTPTPNIDEISKVGGYTRAYTGGELGGETESPTISAVGYMNLLTGTWANKHNVWDNKVEDPNYQYWDIFRIALNHNPSLKTAIFSTWEDNRTKLLGDGLSQAGGSKFSYSFDGLEKDTVKFPHDEMHEYIGKIDDVVANESAQYIKHQGPDLSWVYLEYTDSVAHGYGDSPEFTDSIQDADERVGLIWRAINHRQKNEDEDWLIIVTTDHGRDSETGKDHGGQSARERSIWLSTNSRRLNGNFGNNTSLVDILPTIARHMNLTIPSLINEELEGRPFIN